MAMSVWGHFDRNFAADLYQNKFEPLRLDHLTWVDQIRVLHDLLPFANGFATSIDDINTPSSNILAQMGLQRMHRGNL